MQGMFFGIVKGMQMQIGPKTHAEVVEWARNVLSNHPKAEEVYITSLDATATRSSPPIVVTPFRPDATADNAGNR